MTNEQLSIYLLNLAEILESEIDMVDGAIGDRVARLAKPHWTGLDSMKPLPGSEPELDEAELSSDWEIRRDGDALCMLLLRNRVEIIRQQANSLKESND